MYLGYILRGGQCWLSDVCKEAALRIPAPSNRRQVREFLGSAGFCCLWIPGFAEMAKPLFEAARESQAFEWMNKQEGALTLLSALALGFLKSPSPSACM